MTAGKSGEMNSVRLKRSATVIRVESPVTVNVDFFNFHSKLRSMAVRLKKALPFRRLFLVRKRMP